VARSDLRICPYPDHGRLHRIDDIGKTRQPRSGLRNEFGTKAGPGRESCGESVPAAASPPVAAPVARANTTVRLLDINCLALDINCLDAKRALVPGFAIGSLPLGKRLTKAQRCSARCPSGLEPITSDRRNPPEESSGNSRNTHVGRNAAVLTRVAAQRFQHAAARQRMWTCGCRAGILRMRGLGSASARGNPHDERSHMIREAM